MFALMHLFIGVGASATFGPLLADMSQWFMRHRGIAVGIAASGNYIGGTLWPPVLQHAMATEGWRHTYLGAGIFCALATLPFIFALRRARPVAWMSEAANTGSARNLVVSPNALMVLLCVAGLACCVAMAMPQVHIVAYCGDLGYGPARGAEMLSAMLGFGILSRVGSGLIADRLGATPTLLIGSVLQGIALFLYLLFDGLVSLYIISALFGLFQGGIVPMYAIIVREYFSPKEMGIRIGIVLMATLFGMALGGWMSGIIFDHTGSYRVAFLNGLIWNLVQHGDCSLAVAAAYPQIGGRGVRPAMSLQTQHDPKNEAEISYWNSAGGRRWVERQQSQDIVLGPILQATLERAQLRQGERVVDIGCGTGASSIALAERVGPSEQVLGVDVSAPMLTGAAERLPPDAPVKLVPARSA
jgi:MFS family permease